MGFCPFLSKAYWFDGDLTFWKGEMECQKDDCACWDEDRKCCGLRAVREKEEKI